MGRRSGLSRCGFAFVALLAMAQARADIIDVTITAPGLASMPSVLAFDFIPGGFSPGNKVELSTLTTNGTITLTEMNGDVDSPSPPTFPGRWVFGDGAFFNELLVHLAPETSGAALSLAFSIDTTDIAADSGAAPDSFSFFILDDTSLLPLVHTEQPTWWPNLAWADPLFQFDLGRGEAGLQVFRVVQGPEPGFEITVVRTPSTPVPEPSTVWLLAWLGAAVAVKRRGNRKRGRA